VERIVHDQYGIRGSASRLSSERDELFRIDAADAQYVLRFANPADDPDVIDMQSEALKWIASRAPDLPVPLVVMTDEGQPTSVVEAGGNPPRVVRLTSYLHGQPLPLAIRSGEQMRAIGEALGSLGVALRDFVHPGAEHSLPWDIQRASCLHEIVPPPNSARDDGSKPWYLVRMGLDRFESIVKPRLATLRTQVIHGDFNPHNILVNPADQIRVTGVLDFGDMVHSALVNDVAVAASYQVRSAETMPDVYKLVAAYHRVLPLHDEELGLLHDLMCTRLCAAVAITEWRAERYPENKTYILKNTGIAWNALDVLSSVDRVHMHATLRGVCGLE
jgi:Ser/Thr protein kinase RdoA (MazF antagonist)